jgi:hypothetical protein
VYFNGLGLQAEVEAVDLLLLDSRLTLKGFTTTAPNQRRLSLQQLTVDWYWEGLLDRQVNIANISVNGLTVDVSRNQDAVTGVGGLDLTAMAKPDSEAKSDPKPWQVNLGPVALTNIEACLYHQSQKPADCISWQNLELTSFIKLSAEHPPTLHGDIKLEQLKIGELLNLTGATLTGVEWANNDLAVEQLSLSPLTGSFENYQLALAGFALNQLTLKQLSVPSVGTSQIDQLKLTQAEQPLIEFKQLSLQTSQFDINARAADLNALVLDDFTLWQPSSRGKQDKLAQFKQLSIDSLKGDEQAQQVMTVRVEKLELMTDLRTENDDMLVQLPAATVAKIDVDQQIQISQLALQGLDANLLFDQQQGLNLSSWLAESKTEQKAESAPPAPTKPLSIDVLQLSKSRVTINENSLGEFQQHQLSEIELEVADIKLFAQPTPMNIKLQAKLNQVGQIQAQGQLTPDSENLITAIKAKVTHLALGDYSAYSARHIGYRIDQGQLNGDIKINIANQLIDSQFDLQLNKFELGQLQQHEQNPVNQQLGVPLPMALNLLRDSDNNIALSIPIAGDLNNPDFSLADIVSTVGFKALKSAVLYAYSPLGFVTFTSGIIDLATAMRFKPVEFAPGQTLLTQAAKARLDKVAKVLGDKPQVSLVLCANATQADLAPEQVFNPEDIEALLALGKQRQQLVQQYIHRTADIEKSRLLLCNIKLANESTAQPQVNISL